MIILRYDTNVYSPEELQEYYSWLRKNTGEEVIVLPNELDILFNCSTVDLYSLIDHIKEIIRQKEIANED